MLDRYFAINVKTENYFEKLPDVCEQIYRVQKLSYVHKHTENKEK